jgi:hypothetical protein
MFHFYEIPQELIEQMQQIVDDRLLRWMVRAERTTETK